MSLQIDGMWAVLPDDVEITLTRTSPIFGSGNAFSYEFDLPIQANLHILQSSPDGHGISVYKALHGKPFRLYAGGLPIQTGVVKLDDTTEVNLDEDVVSLSLVSDRMELEDLIKDKTLRDLDIASDRIHIGTRFKDVEFTVVSYLSGTYGYVEFEDTTIKCDLPSALFAMSQYNISAPYPLAKYCNIRICYQNKKAVVDEQEGEANPDTNWHLMGSIVSEGTQESGNPYIISEANREASAPCFYIHYLLVKMLHQFGVSIAEDTLSSIEDFDRTALISTKFTFYDGEGVHIRYGARMPEELRVNGYDKGMSEFFSVEAPSTVASWADDTLHADSTECKVSIRKCYANAQGLPTTTLSDFVRGLEHGFGIRMLFNSASRSVRLVYMRDILRQTDVTPLNCLVVGQPHKIENQIQGFTLTYGHTEDVQDETDNNRDTTYNYNDYSQVQTFDDYNSVIASVSKYDKTCYVSNVTGNAYRIKVNKSAKKESEWYPALYEVGQFVDAHYGDVSDEDRVEKVEIGFTPIVLNDCAYRTAVDMQMDASPEKVSQALALYVDTELMSSGTFEDSYTFSYKPVPKPEYVERQLPVLKPVRITGKVSRTSLQCINVSDDDKSTDVGNYDEHPIQEYDCGFMLGVMRGPGNDSGVENYDENYDGEGNSKWVQTPGNYATTSDSCNDYGAVYDYNGTEQGGVDMNQRFSLKLRAEKQKSDGSFYSISNPDLRRRAIFDKLYSEYAKWTVDSRIMRFTLKMELADMLSIDLTKKYRILDYVGFVKEFTMPLHIQDGVGEISLDLMYL